MELHVESRLGFQGNLEPTVFELGDKTLKILQIVDRWNASDHTYFKIEAEDSDIYILRYTQEERHWELTLFQARTGLEFMAAYMPSRRNKAWQAN